MSAVSKNNNVLDFLNHFESKHRAFISLILRPLFMLLMFLSVGYYTMWLSSTYVKQTTFTQYLEKQAAQDTKQDELAKSRFEIIQSRLDVLINQQTIYNEQLKGINQLLLTHQRQIDALNERITYLERNARRISGE